MHWEAYVFLHIPDDPSCVYYSVCVPSLDVQDDTSCCATVVENFMSQMTRYVHLC